MERQAQGNGFPRQVAREPKLVRYIHAIVILGLLCPVLVPIGAAKRPLKRISTADGRPVRKVYIRTASPETANSVTAELAQDTCLMTVSDENQADAVLDLGMVLPGVGGAAPIPNVFVPSTTEQTLGNAKTQPQRTASANCTNGKDGGCSGSYNIQGGDLGTDLPPGFGKTGGSGLDVSLISTGQASQELWEPEAHSKRPWTDQLRRAAGCPVCPGERFNRRKDGAYRTWIQAKCPGVLAADGPQ